MPRLIDLTGLRFGRLVVKERALNIKSTHPKWLCVCDCGGEKIVDGSHLRGGLIQSCRCLQKETIAAISTTHGRTGTTEYGIWVDMKKRCNNPKHARWKDYGGRGISVDPRWNDFKAFFADMGYRPSKKHSLDRRDNDGPYSKSNCRWATQKEQVRNSRKARLITYQGETKSMAAWAEDLGINYSTLRARLAHGWPLDRAFIVS